MASKHSQLRAARPVPPYTTRLSGSSATSGSRLFIRQRSTASVCQLRQLSSVPRAARTGRATAVIAAPPTRPAARRANGTRAANPRPPPGRRRGRGRRRGAATRSRSDATTAAVAGPGRNGARSSSACAAATSSAASTRRRAATLRRVRIAAVKPIDTWSSWPALVDMLCTAMGVAAARSSTTIAAAVYWLIINPLLSPGLAVRKAGRPRERAGSRSRSRRRSLIAATSAHTLASMSAA